LFGSADAQREALDALDDDMVALAEVDVLAVLPAGLSAPQRAVDEHLADRLELVAHDAHVADERVGPGPRAPARDAGDALGHREERDPGHEREDERDHDHERGAATGSVDGDRPAGHERDQAEDAEDAKRRQMRLGDHEAGAQQHQHDARDDHVQ
jgi:hypothetical protein